MILHAQLLQSRPTLFDPVDCSTSDSSVHGDSPGSNTGVGCHFLLQGILLTQGLNPCLLSLLHWQACSLPLKVKVAQLGPTLCDPMDYTVCGILQARILERVAVPFSRRSSQSRNRTRVSCIGVDSLPAEPPQKPSVQFSRSVVSNSL